MSRTARALLILAALAMLAGCGGASHPIRYYTIDLPAAPDAAHNPYPVTLLVARVTAPMILRDDRIVYRSGANELGTYEYRRWAEPPAVLLETCLLRMLRASGRYESVSEVTSKTRGDFLLRARLYDFEEVDSNAIAARVALEAELVDAKSGKVVWSHSYSHDEPVSEDDVASVVAALNKNLERGLGEVSAGLDAYFAKNPPKPQ
ncbi:MAG TPA: ABC-type transport auxiliary lipoprotein family protein [Terriglobia bacterium]|nr:ABC-type transport auxiliary lipoprotein family protein [Terriglobia bacterium]